MKKSAKNFSISALLVLVILILSFGVVRAALTLDATSVVSDGAITVRGAAGSAIIIGHDAQTGTISVASSSGAMTLLLGNGSGVKTVKIGTDAANTITIGSSSATGVSIEDNNWSVDTAGAAVLVSLNLGTTAVSDVISATTSLNFAAAASPNSCQERDKTVTGAAQGDTVMVNPGNFNPAAHHLFYAFASSTNAVTIRNCYATSTAPTDPDGGAGSPFYRITIIKF